MAGLRGQNRSPRAPVRERRNFDSLATSPQFIDPASPIQIGGDGRFVLQLADQPALTAAGSSLAVLLDTDPGLIVTADGLSALVQDVLTIDGSGVKLNYGAGLQNDGAGSLQANLGGGLGFDAGAIAVQGGDGVAVGADLTVQPRDTSLIVDAAGVGVALDSDGGIGLSADGLLIIGGIPITVEVPSGTIDGVNDTFTVSDVPTEGVVLVFVDGLLMAEGSGKDFQRVDTTITFESGSIPETGDVLLAAFLEGAGAAGEIPAGTVDGVNDTFTLSNEPKPASVMLFVAGLLMTRGASADFTVSGSTLTLADPPLAGDVLWVAYEKESN